MQANFRITFPKKSRHVITATPEQVILHVTSKEEDSISLQAPASIALAAFAKQEADYRLSDNFDLDPGLVPEHVRKEIEDSIRGIINDNTGEAIYECTRETLLKYRLIEED